MGGFEIAHQLEEYGSSGKILLMSAHMDRFYIQELLKAGAAAYLVKDEAWRCLAEAIRRVAQGKQVGLGRWIRPTGGLPSEFRFPNEQNKHQVVSL
jgi:DNA-binding NarL/FixJ family response regulator